MVRMTLSAAVVVLAVAVTGFSLVLHEGLSADRPPGPIETAVARRLVRLSIPASERATTNPHASHVDAWREGAEHFADHCAFCHGEDGRGRSAVGEHMYPPVPDLASADVQRLSDGALFAIIQHGIRWTGMPAFQADHTADETWDLVSFVRHVPALESEPESEADSEKALASANADKRAPARIDIDGTAFVPAELTVRVGDLVTWTNKDPFPHNVMSATGGFRSGNLQPNQQWQFRPAKAGRFPYVCTLHPGMKGTLIVEPATQRRER